MFKNKQKITVSNYFYLNPKRCGSFFLVQAGESFCSTDTVIPSHMQRCFEITYAIGGKAVCYRDSTPIEISKNDCFFSFAGEEHKIESDSKDPLHFIFLAFYAKAKTREERYIEFIKNLFFDSFERKINAPEISERLMLILNELTTADEYTPRAIHSHLEGILIEICRKTENKPRNAYPIRHSDSEMLAKDLISYINEHIGQILDVSSLSDVFHYSKPTLSKIFLVETGLTIGKYIKGKRMELANRMLTDGLSVTDVSEKLGYSSIHTFSRAYKSYFNCTPSSKKSL